MKKGKKYTLHRQRKSYSGGIWRNLSEQILQRGMFIDKDSWGKFSINDLSEKDLRFIYEALKVYAQCNMGHIHPEDSVRMFVFDNEFNSLIQHE